LVGLATIGERDEQLQRKIAPIRKIIIILIGFVGATRRRVCFVKDLTMLQELPPFDYNTFARF
jgi:hypothetical protein